MSPGFNPPLALLTQRQFHSRTAPTHGRAMSCSLWCFVALAPASVLSTAGSLTSKLSVSTILFSTCPYTILGDSDNFCRTEFERCGAVRHLRASSIYCQVVIVRCQPLQVSHDQPTQAGHEPEETHRHAWIPLMQPGTRHGRRRWQ